MRWIHAVLLGCVAVAAAVPSIAAEPGQPLVIHEWGTFTSLQNAAGESLGAINVDDEPVPAFVHTIGRDGFIADSKPHLRMTKGPFTSLNPDIAMRLETPVVYFYLPEFAQRPMKLDLAVTFNGGYLSQFYPFAESSSQPGSSQRIPASTKHSLTWRDLQIGTTAEGPATKDHVWLAPRNVKADSVTSANGQSEKYLFYRGVGNLESPLKVMQTADSLSINGRPHPQAVGAFPIDALWLVEIRADGALAFRKAANSYSTDERSQTPEHRLPLKFADSEFAKENLGALRKEMSAAMQKQGLFADEAEAMLDTWEASYFKSPGTRVLYTVPQGWTDAVLPLKVSVPAEITRVMVGRIELVTARHEELLSRITQVAEVPQLGRFAGAMLHDAQKRHPSQRLMELITYAGLGPSPTSELERLLAAPVVSPAAPATQPVPLP